MLSLTDKITVEGIIGAGLVVALISSVFLGNEKLSEDITMGLIGYMGRHVVSK